MVFQKQKNEKGNYKDGQNVRWEILSCERTESKEWVQIGTKTGIIYGKSVEIPIMEQRFVINKGWDAFESLEEAASYYGLTYDPLNPEGIIDNQEEID